MEEQSRDLRDYFNVLRKYKTSMLVIIITIISICAVAAVVWPPTYKSSATILIERQSIPTELVQSTVTSYASERIKTIQAQVMSRTNLMEIIKKFDLYQDRLKFETTEEIIQRMRDNVSLEIISAEVVDPRTGRPSEATIAFSLSFEGENPKKVQRVTGELTSLYLDENVKSRTQKAEDTSIFLREESERLDKLITDLEEKLSTFKQENSNALPEVQQFNLQALQRMELEHSAIISKLQNLEEKRIYLRGQLTQISPDSQSVNSPAFRLKALEAEITSLRARYSEDHPDVIKLENEIESLKAQTNGSGVNTASRIAEQLSNLRTDYAEISEKYGPEHPDVIAMESKIAALEAKLKQSDNNVEKTYYEDNPENPAYITLKAQLEGVKSDISSTQLQKKRVQDKIAELERSIIKGPDVEKQYLNLQRDYQNAVSQYKETKTKLMRAESAKQLESESKGERFTLIDPPALPEQPISPNRPAILFLGVILSIGGSIGFAIISDMFAGVVRGAKNVQMVLGVSPLSVIPYQWNTLALKKRAQARKRFILTGIVSMIALTVAIHLFVTPLDVIWFRLIRKLETLFIY